MREKLTKLMKFHLTEVVKSDECAKSHFINSVTLHNNNNNNDDDVIPTHAHTEIDIQTHTRAHTHMRIIIANYIIVI